MRSRMAIFVVALVLGMTGWAVAQVPVETGTVYRVDPQSSVVVLDDGRIYRVTPNTAFFIDNRPATFATLRGGERVVIQSGEPVVFRDGRYIPLQPVTVTQSSQPVAVVTQQVQPGTVVTPQPGTSVVVTQQPAASVAMPIGVKQTMYGTVTDVDRNGKIKIKTARDSFETRVSPEALRQIRKGDNVVIDLTINSPGAPAR